MANKKKFYLMGKSKFYRFGSLTLTRAVYSGEVAKILHKKSGNYAKMTELRIWYLFSSEGVEGINFETICPCLKKHIYQFFLF